MIDLSNCASEPIHIPGQIQSHGFLFVLDQSHIVTYCSDNIFNLLHKTSIELIGSQLHTIEQLIGKNQPEGFIRNLLSIGKVNRSFEQINPYKLDIDDISYYLIISSSNEQYLLELESATSEALPDVQKMMGHSISKMLADKNLQNVLDNTASQVKNTILFDRVMIYRFAEDGHGEVISEAKNEELSSWLGLHYPATDIPQQARELYKLNLTRIIANVESTPVNVSAASGQLKPLNMTYSQLRAVSPIHIQYLKNMGVSSSFSISILCKGELWGLIACHHYSPKFIDFLARDLSKLLGQILSSALEFRQEEIQQYTQETFTSSLDKLTKQLQEKESLEQALTQCPVTMLDIVHASGAVLVYEKKITKVGLTPDDDQIKELIKWLKQNIDQPLYHLTNLSMHYPAANSYCGVASGMLMMAISKELEEYIIFFKPEQPQFITWAGNPDKVLAINKNGLLGISPRNSFQQWSQTVLATSVAWTTEEINAALRLQEEITYTINRKAGAIRLLNDQLQVAYDELDTFSYTISHDLKNPIAAIKSYAQLVARSQGFSDRDRMMLGRINERADQMYLMIEAILGYSRIGRSPFIFQHINTLNLIEDIVKDLLLIYESHNVTITIGDTPDIKGDPMMMLQIFSNLIGNAVKYSKHVDAPAVHIEGTVNDNDICYTIKDNGLGIAPKDLNNVFDLFSRMDNVKSIEGSGVGLAIVKRVVEKHKGRIWVESQLHKGSVFYVSFNK